MELQALASHKNRSWSDRVQLPGLIRRIAYHYGDDLLLVLLLCSASPDVRSLQSGLGIVALGIMLNCWIEGYDLKPHLFAIVGPFRFVRYPQRLALWLVWIGLSLAARSFPTLLCSLGLLPLFYWRDTMLRDKTRESRELDAYRYRQYVPALVPTFFPYQLAQAAAGPHFAWRRAFFHADPLRQRMLLTVAFAFSFLLLAQLDFLPSWGLIAAAAVWSFLRMALMWYRHRSFFAQS